MWWTEIFTMQGATSVFTGRPVGSFLHQLFSWGFNIPSFSLPSSNKLILVKLPMILGFADLQFEVKIDFQAEA